MKWDKNDYKWLSDPDWSERQGEAIKFCTLSQASSQENAIVRPRTWSDQLDVASKMFRKCS